VDTYYVSIYEDTYHRRAPLAGLCGGQRTLTFYLEIRLYLLQALVGL